MVRVPLAVRKRINLKSGDALEIDVVHGKIVVTPLARCPARYDIKELARRITPSNRYKVQEFGGARGREVA